MFVPVILLSSTFVFICLFERIQSSTDLITTTTRPNSIVDIFPTTSTTIEDVPLYDSTLSPNENFNVTLSPAERKKRLLPYENFYFKQPFNRPHLAGVSAQQYRDYVEYVEPHPKKNTKINAASAYRNQQNDVPYQHHQYSQKFTPFLDSNALPGGFRPMKPSENTKHQNLQYVVLNPSSPPPPSPPQLSQQQQQSQNSDTYNEENPKTDLRTIYEKLSQLKLRQQQNVRNGKLPYGYRLNSYSHRYQDRPQKNPINYNRYKIQPSKTFIETFTATNIDIPAPGEDDETSNNYKYPAESSRYHHMPTPINEDYQTRSKTHTPRPHNTKPFVYQHIAIDVPQISIPVPFKSSSNQVRKPVLQQQQQQHHHHHHHHPTSPQHPHIQTQHRQQDRSTKRPYVIVHQRKPSTTPTKLQQQVYVLRKAKPQVVVEENYSADKFIPVVPKQPEENQYEIHSYHHHHNQQLPIAHQTQYQVTPAPNSLHDYDTSYVDAPASQYEVTPTPIEEYESFPPPLPPVPPPSTVPPRQHNYIVGRYGSKIQTVKPQIQRIVEFVPIVTSIAPSQEIEVEHQHVDANDDEDERENYYQLQTSERITSEPPLYRYEPVRITPKTPYQHNLTTKYQQSMDYVERPSSSDSNSLAEILRQLQESNTLPHTLTPANIDNSIKTLVRILNALRSRQKYQKPVVIQDDYPNQGDNNDHENEAGVNYDHTNNNNNNVYHGGGGDGDGLSDTTEGSTPGKAGVDYPALSNIPKTNFNCKSQRYKGFFGDPDTNCQVWHYCDLNGGQASFLCPNGTIFSQVALTCDWWFNVKCASTPQLYVLNERLYKYIIPLSPKFPEDYSGPLVDKYLALKFQEMEEKLRKQKKGKANSIDSEIPDDDDDDNDSDDTQSKNEKIHDTEKANSLEDIENDNSPEPNPDESRIKSSTETNTSTDSEITTTTTVPADAVATITTKTTEITTR